MRCIYRLDVGRCVENLKLFKKKKNKEKKVSIVLHKKKGERKREFKQNCTAFVYLIPLPRSLSISLSGYDSDPAQ